MKSKLFKILGVITVVAMLASALVASPVFAATAVSAVTVTTTSAGGIISATGVYSIYATLTTQLVATNSGNYYFHRCRFFYICIRYRIRPGCPNSLCGWTITGVAGAGVY